VAQVSRVTDHLRKGKFASLSGLAADQGIVLWFVGPVRPILFPGPSPLGSGGGPFLCRTILALDLSVQLRQIVQARLTAGRSFGVSSARNCWKPDMSNPPNECRRQVLACVRLAQASTSAKDRAAFAKLAKIWLSLVSDLEELDRQLKSEPEKRKTG
jgi:hypothetical protein